MLNSFKLFFWNLPYSIRRLIFILIKPLSYLKLNRMKTESNSKGYSFEGFVKNNCIFIHIPKAAGLSLNYSLFNNKGGGHRFILDYSLIFSKSKFDNYYKFSFVRNPYDRLFSAFRFLKSGGISSYDKTWSVVNLSNVSSFEDFVLNWLSKDKLHSIIHFYPQYEFVCDINGEIIVDKIFYFETIDKDFNTLCSILGINNNLNFHNKTNSNIKEFYSEKMKEKVFLLYQKDFELFNYSK